MASFLCPLSAIVHAKAATTMEELICLNVGGTRFLTYHSTLSTLPGTRLSNLSHLDSNYDPQTGEYFFDRTPTLFEFILNYYRTGELHFPQCLCGPGIKAELEYWGLDENCISPCCWKAYSAYEDEKQTVMELSKTLGVNVAAGTTGVCSQATPSRSSQRAEDTPESWWTGFRWKLWRFLEKPQTSLGAKVGKHPKDFNIITRDCSKL